MKRPTAIDQAIQKAALLLDLRNDREAAENTLRRALMQHGDTDPAGAVGASLFLAELLVESGEVTAASEFLASAKHCIARYSGFDDLFAENVVRVSEKLAERQPRRSVSS